MIHPMKLVKMARKSFSKAADTAAGSEYSCSKSIADKEHFVIYTIDGRRFMVPLEYLQNPIFQQLFKISEYVFGLPSDGPITLPCDTVFMEYIVSSVQRNVSEDDLEKDLLSSISSCKPVLSILKLSHCTTAQSANDSSPIHGF